MASLDFVTTLTEKLSKQNIDYIIITAQRGKQGNKIHVFYDMPDLESISCMVEGITDASDIIKDLHSEYSSENKKKNGKKNK